jgi:uncharacterized protein YkvS
MTVGKIAKEGDTILFKRNGSEIVGEVFKVNEGSVIVNIQSSDAKKINIDTPRTVVSHKNYQILK